MSPGPMTARVAGTLGTSVLACVAGSSVTWALTGTAWLTPGVTGAALVLVGLLTFLARRPDFLPPAYVPHDGWDVASTPLEWLSRTGAFSKPTPEVEGVVTEALARQLSPLPRKAGSAEARLLEAFRTVADGRPDEGRALIAALDRAARRIHGDQGNWRAAMDVRISGSRGVQGSTTVYPTPLNGTYETLFAAELRRARKVAPLPSHTFRWLKGYDRGLWYALNNLGRASFHVEGAGAMAHLASEDRAGHALTMPAVGAASAPLTRTALRTMEIDPTEFALRNKARARTTHLVRKPQIWIGRNHPRGEHDA